jgi:hypothetical protein
MVNVALVKSLNTAVCSTDLEEKPAVNTEKEKKMYKLTITQKREENTENNGVFELNDDVKFYGSNIMDIVCIVEKLESLFSEGVSYRIEKTEEFTNVVR